MAVEAHHLRLFYPQFLLDRGSVAEVSEAWNPAMDGNAVAGVLMPHAMSGISSSPLYSSAMAPSESGLTVSACAGKKRAREAVCFLGDEISAHFQQQMLDLDLLLAHHRERMRAEMAERQKTFYRQLAAAIEVWVRKRLKVKEDEMERLSKLNMAMEERIRTLSVENQIWRELAQTNEATANFLRTNLEQILAAQTQTKEEQLRGDEAVAAADDAESCCCGGNDDRDTPEMAATSPLVRACRSCGVREPTVFLLPCRHLCLCAACAPATGCCPVCSCCKTGTVHVKLS